MKLFKLSLIFCLIAAILGCAPSRSANVYTRGQARQVETIKTGVVQQIDNVTLQDEATPVGSIGGAVVGGIAASSIGKGTGSAIASTLGAILGGVIGTNVEKQVNSSRGFKIIVKMDNSNEMIAVVQEADIAFRVGQRVKVLTSTDPFSKVTVRVSP
jgi:outer membrane lipoprotein SlyB